MKKKGLPLVIYAMVIAAFAMGADEFIIAGVVPQVSEALSVSIGAVGFLATAYAIGAAVGAPLFAAISSVIARRAVMMASVVVFIVGNVISALGPTYEAVMVGRVVAAMSHGAFLGIASVYAAGLVAPNLKGSAIATVFAGLTAATVLGAPLGAAVGQAFGWRWSFGVLVAFVALVALLPREGSPKAVAHAEAEGGPHGDEEPELDAHARMHLGQEEHGASLREQLKALGRTPVWLGLLTTFFAYGGIFTSYVYLAPQITDVTGLAPVWVAPLFLLFGLGLFVGNAIGGKLTDRSIMPAMVGTVGALVVAMFAMTLAILNPVTAVAGIFLYGVAAFAVVAPLQLRVVAKAGDAPDVSSAGNISAFTLGTALGA